MLMMAINRIRNQHRGDDLVAKRSNRNAHNGTNIITLDILRLHAKDHHAYNNRQKTQVRDPYPVLGRRGVTEGRRRPLVAPHHPVVGAPTAKLLAEHGADDHAGELQADLLRVEAEFCPEELRDLDGEEDGGEVEDYGVGDGGAEDVGVGEELDGGEEGGGGEGGGIDFAEVEVFAAEGGLGAY